MDAENGLRIAHMTDVHIQAERGGKDGLVQALEHMRVLDRPPSLLLTGGDAVMNATGEPPERVDAQWMLWQRAFAAACDIETFHCLGNHDVLNWDADDGVAAVHKERALRELSMADRFYSFDRGGWHFIVLDSCQPLNGGYTAHVDAAQWAWLNADLQRAGNAPTCIVSHVPILSVTGAIYDDGRVQDHHWQIPGDWMHTDAHALQALFVEYPNVRLCLSGHMHLRDRCEYNGVTYICDGALCAGWWGGDWAQCDEGYGLFDLRPDGSFDYEYVPFGWQVRD